MLVAYELQTAKRRRKEDEGFGEVQCEGELGRVSELWLVGERSWRVEGKMRTGIKQDGKRQQKKIEKDERE